KLHGSVRDLTSVGVGVSQTLPLLVGLLTAPHNSIFIVEQPELHLHPAVQARLADFMLSARPDVAVVIETHSESFITRVRRRAAEEAIAVTDVDISFVEPHDGGSIARTLQLSEFGDLSEWPDGFLSSAEEDIREILKRNIMRSRRMQTDG
ncbi:AAA family ATPase, partial [Flavobacterium myungsuense]|uniref:AAA family ATPase n=1 Tax=Flavobacterium myungsuense TaxID=651823 RepID=UPI003616C82A